MKRLILGCTVILCGFMAGCTALICGAILQVSVSFYLAICALAVVVGGVIAGVGGYAHTAAMKAQGMDVEEDDKP